MLAILFFTVAALSAGPAPASAACVVGIPLDTLIEHYPLVFEADVVGKPRETTVRFDTPPGAPDVLWKGLLLRMRVREVCAPTIERERASAEMLAFLDRLKKQRPPATR